MISLPILQREVSELWKFRIRNDAEIEISLDENLEEFIIASGEESIKVPQPIGNNLDDYSEKLLLSALRKLNEQMNKWPRS